MRIDKLSEKDKIAVITKRKEGAATLWSKISEIYDKNVKLYEGQPDWVRNIPGTLPKFSINRAFTNMEATINSVLSNPPQPNVVPSTSDEEAVRVAHGLEKKFIKTYKDRNVKETLRKAVRDLYFSRLLVLKPFWNASIDDIDVKRVDPRKVRFSTSANNTDESEWFFEEVDSTVWTLLEKYGRTPELRKTILEASNMSELDAYIQNPSCTYNECWYTDYLIVEYNRKILWEGRNTYFDFDGVLVTKGEFNEIIKSEGKENKKYLEYKNQEIEEPGETELDLPKKTNVQEMRRKEMQEYVDSKSEGDKPYDAYLLNHFDRPRMPYIVASLFKNEDGPIGRTSFLEMAAPLCELADGRKLDIVKNARFVNGNLKVDKSTMTQKDAAKILYEAGGLIYGKGVVGGVQRETGPALPQFVQLDLQETLNEIDNIMAATSAFRGEREGQETKAGRLALIEQSFLRLNELVQVIDYVTYELFNWWFQLALTRYTNAHLVKDLGEDSAMEVFELSQENMQKGTQIRVIPGKTLPEDRQFRYERAQADVAAQRISPMQYFKDAGYEDPKAVAKEAFEFQNNPAAVLGVEQEQMPEMPPEMAPQEI